VAAAAASFIKIVISLAALSCARPTRSFKRRSPFAKSEARRKESAVVKAANLSRWLWWVKLRSFRCAMVEVVQVMVVKG